MWTMFSTGFTLSMPRSREFTRFTILRRSPNGSAPARKVLIDSRPSLDDVCILKAHPRESALLVNVKVLLR